MAHYRNKDYSNHLKGFKEAPDSWTAPVALASGAVLVWLLLITSL